MSSKRKKLTIGSSLQLSFFTPGSDWTPIADFPSLQQFPVIGLDTETHDPNLSIEGRGSGWPTKTGELVGVSISTPAWDRYYPIAHKGGGNLDKRQVVGWLTDELRNYTGKIITANGLYDKGWLWTEGVEANYADWIDVQWTDVLLDENQQSYSLENICKRYDLPGKDESLLRQAAESLGVDPKAGLHLLHSKFVGPYAMADAQRPVKIFEKQWPQIQADNLEKIFRLEHKLFPILFKMRRKGVPVDLDRAERAYYALKAKSKEALEEIHKLTGKSPNVHSSEEIAPIFDSLGLKYPRTSLGAPSFTADWLKVQDHPLPKLIVNARKFEKGAGTFVRSTIIERARNGRVHPEFHPLRFDKEEEGTKKGAISGRFSGTDPNMQYIPARDEEIGPVVRSCFVAEKGQIFAAPDYSQQEPRLLIHYAALMGYPGARAAANRFHNEPDLSYHTMVAELTGLPYKRAKEVNLGIPYGMGGAKLCEVYLKLPTKMWETPDGNMVPVAGDEGKKILDTYHSRLPYVKKMIEMTKERAEEKGFITTLLGRRCRFNLWEPIKGYYGKPLPYNEAIEKFGEGRIRRSMLHKALNKLIQGSAADMIKQSIIDLDAADLTPMLTVHDENGLSVDSLEDARRAAKIMEQTVSLELPLKIDLAVGPSWGEAKDVK